MAARRAIEAVLVVDDDHALVRAFERYLRSHGKTVFGAAEAQTARDIARNERPQLAIVDLMLPGSTSSIELIRQLKRDLPSIRIVTIIGYANVFTTVAAVRAGAELVWSKPVTPKELMRLVREGMPEPRIGEVPTMRRAKYEHAVRVLADCNNNVSHAAQRLAVSRTTLQRIRRAAPRR
jgi:two-component system response regulator RegA